MRKKITLHYLSKLKESGTPATFLTAYDYPSACFADRAGVEIILVGDSAGMTMLGHKNTLPVTMEDMMVFSNAVGRANPTAFVVGDMPFMSYQLTAEKAVQNAGRFIAEAGCDAVKLEGGERMADKIKSIVDAGIPVMAHLGMTPQSMSAQSGYRVQGKTLESFKSVLKDALAVQEAGACLLLLEAMPEEPAAYICKELKIPVYGIGAGKKLDGQLLIYHDVMGTFVGDIKPKFAKRYLNGAEMMTEALQNYVRDVKEGTFPAAEHIYDLDASVWEKIRESI